MYMSTRSTIVRTTANSTRERNTSISYSLNPYLRYTFEIQNRSMPLDVVSLKENYL
jgi:hypothetical protein